METPKSNVPTVFIVDDNAGVVKSLQWLVDSVGYRVASFSDAQGFLDAYQDDQTGVLLLDIRMPRLTGLELQELMIERGISLPIIFITGHGDISMAVRAMKKGACDFLTKPINNQILLEAINKAVELDARRRKKEKISTIVAARMENLTQREYEVMQLMLAGKPTKTMAQELGISTNTVDIHRSRVMKKMEAKTLAELIKLMAQLKQSTSFN